MLYVLILMFREAPVSDYQGTRAPTRRGLDVMRALIAHDDNQLRRIVSAIAGIEALPPADRHRMTALYDALQSEKTELLRANPRLRQRLAPIGRPERALRAAV